MKDYFRHYGNIAITDISMHSYRLTTEIHNEIHREVVKLGYKPNTLEYFNKRYIIAQERLMKVSKK
jgi:hypothetical protein